MRNDKKTFTHLSLQDAKSIKPILEAISKGLNKGELRFKNDDDEITLKPDGLLRLKVSASKSVNRNKLNIKISWETADSTSDRADSLEIHPKAKKGK